MRSTSTILLLLAAAAAVSADNYKIHGSRHHSTSHSDIEAELNNNNNDNNSNNYVEGFTCTITGATGQGQCDAAKDDDGSGCVWCVVNTFGFCVSETQAEEFKQVMPNIDCDDDDSNDDDKAPGPAADDDTAPGPLWECLEAPDEESCGESCVWCDTKGGFGVCLTPEGAEMAKDSYWFTCKSIKLDAWTSGASIDDGSDDVSGDDDDDDEEADYEDEEADYEDEEVDNEEAEPEQEEDNLNEFVVDTNCVTAGVFLDPKDDDATSEAACFAAKDVSGNPCEFCSIAGSPFRLCLSEPQAQVAEYVGAVCTGSDESFEPEDFDDSCIAHMHADANLSKEGCWSHQDLDGNGCEWCNVMGVELCLGGVQAELVEHWGATCVMDHEEHDMATEAIAQHRAYLEAEAQARRAQQPEATTDEEEELDLSTLWLTSDPSCMVTTLRTTDGSDPEFSCAQANDSQGNPCNWCEIGTSFNMCLNEEQAIIAEYMGLACDQRKKDGTFGDDVDDFDPSCIMAMQNGPDKATCVAASDAEGNKCEWCSWNSFNACLAPEQAGMVEPFGVTCDKTALRAPGIPAEKMVKVEDIDTSCLVNMDEPTCEASKDAVANKSCEWCTLGSLGISGCMSGDQAAMAKPLGVTCGGVAPVKPTDEDEEVPFLYDLPDDFWSCLSQSSGVDNCGETCTWCNVKGSSTAGFCLSDPIADIITHFSDDKYLDCTEPDDSEEEEEREQNFGDVIVDALDHSIA